LAILFFGISSITPVRLSVDFRYFLGQVPGLECPLFDLNPTLTPLKTPFRTSYGVVLRCFWIVMALTVDWLWIDRGWLWWPMALTLVLTAYWPWLRAMEYPPCRIFWRTHTLKTPFQSRYGVVSPMLWRWLWIDYGLTMVAYGVDHGVDGLLNVDGHLLSSTW